MKSPLIEEIIKQTQGFKPWWKDTEDKRLFINLRDYLETLAQAGKVVGIVPFYDDDRKEKIAKAFGIDAGDLRELNTYNNDSGYLSHTLEIYLHADPKTDRLYIAIAPHISGDVRCNYADFILFKFCNIYDFDEAINALEDRNAFDIKVDGETYTITPRVEFPLNIYPHGTAESFESYETSLDGVIDNIKDYNRMEAEA